MAGGIDLREEPVMRDRVDGEDAVGAGHYLGRSSAAAVAPSLGHDGPDAGRFDGLVDSFGGSSRTVKAFRQL